MSEARFEMPEETPETPEVEVTPKAEEAEKPADLEPVPEAEETTTEAEKPEETPDEPKKPKNSFKRQIDKLYKKAAEAEARAQQLEEQVTKLKPKPVEGLPKLEDFDFDVDAYARAYAEHEKTQALKQYQEDQRIQTQKQAEKRIVDDWNEKVTKAESKYEDFDDIVGDLSPTNAVNIAIMQAENGSDIAYYLASHIDEARKIAALDPINAIREIGRLETKLAEPVKPKVPSKAPEPIVPLTGKSSVGSNEPSDDDDDETWIRKRSKQVRS